MSFETQKQFAKYLAQESKGDTAEAVKLITAAQTVMIVMFD